jgi:nitrogen PTS system EIIA component
MNINELARLEGVYFMDAASKQEALSQLLNMATAPSGLEKPKALEQAIKEREQIISTGIGLGVAIPHAKINGLHEFTLTVGIVARGIDWDSIDELPVQIIFLIIGPDNQQTNYLKILAHLSLIIKSPTLRQELITADNATIVTDILNRPLGTKPKEKL